jgi:hypothetical protein
MQNGAMTSRILARQLRQKLAARNNSPLFRLMLDSLTDEHLLELYAEHHQTRLDAARDEVPSWHRA